MKIKVMYILLILITLVSLIINFRVDAPYDEVNERIEMATFKLEQLYENQEQEFLVSNINFEQLTEIRSLLNSEQIHILDEDQVRKFNDLNKELAIIEQMVNLEVKVDTLQNKNDTPSSREELFTVIAEIEQLQPLKPQFVARKLQIMEELKNKKEIFPVATQVNATR